MLLRIDSVLLPHIPVFKRWTEAWSGCVWPTIVKVILEGRTVSCLQKGSRENSVQREN